MRKFQRSSYTVVKNIFNIIGIILIVMSLIETVLRVKGYGYPEIFRKTIIIMFVLSFVSSLIIISVMPPDFCYCIITGQDYIVFEMSDRDRRRINKSFNIYEKTRRYMVLDDGISRISIAYNKEVWKYLNEIKN